MFRECFSLFIDTNIGLWLRFRFLLICLSLVGTLADSGFFKNLLHQGDVKSTVFWLFEDLKFKTSEGCHQNWCFPDSAQVAVSV